jgi:hypothetical protein
MLRKSFYGEVLQPITEESSVKPFINGEREKKTQIYTYASNWSRFSMLIFQMRSFKFHIAHHSSMYLLNVGLHICRKNNQQNKNYVPTNHRRQNK